MRQLTEKEAELLKQIKDEYGKAKPDTARIEALRDELKWERISMSMEAYLLRCQGTHFRYYYEQCKGRSRP